MNRGTESPFPEARPPKVEPDSIRLLLEMTAKLRLSSNPQFARLVAGVATAGNQAAARKLVKLLAPAFYQNQVAPNHFLSTESDLDGPILIGHTPDGRRFGLRPEHLVRHTGIFGGSGFGKSNLLDLIATQARDNAIHTIVFDRKADMQHHARDGVDCIHWSQMRINPLCPAHRAVSIFEHRNDFVPAFCELMQFQQRGTSIFLLGLDALYKAFDVYERWPRWDWHTMAFPTLLDLLDVFKSDEFSKRVKGQGAESRLSVVDKLESLIIQLGPIISCRRSLDMERLYKDRRLVDYVVEGLSVEFQNFLIISELIRYAHFFKTFGPRNVLNALFIFDEAKGIFGRTMQNNFIVKDLVAKVREWGIGLVAADQIPSEISQFFFSNIGTLIMFRHSDGNDLQRLMYSSGATRDQILANYSLKPGEAIVRSMKSADLHKVTVQFNGAVEKFIAREEVDRLMAPRIAQLHEDVIPILPQNQPRHAQAKAGPPKLDTEERLFLEGLAKDFNRPSSEVYRALGVRPSAGFRLKKRLSAKGYISEVATSLGKDGKRAVYLVPDLAALAQLGIPVGSGRGGALHRHLQADFKAQAERLGFEVTIEPVLSESSEAPDLALSRGAVNIAVEISVTSKPSTEADNVAKNLGFGFAHVMLTFVRRDSLDRAKRLCIAKYSAEVMARVHFCLTTEFAVALAEIA